MEKNRELLSGFNALGFQLLGGGDNYDANMVLSEAVKSRNMRFWEGFPVMLANAADKEMFDYNKVKEYLKKQSDNNCLDSLLSMSYALYESFGLKFAWASAVYKKLPPNKRNEYKNFLEKLKKNEDFKVAGYVMSSQRLKTVFNNYFPKSQPQTRLNELLSMKEELSFEYALAQVFSPKQKELFLKRLKGEKLTKTEKEYFSRAVKKKVLALANPELHNLSQRLL